MTLPRLDRLITLHIPGASTTNDFGESIPGASVDHRAWAQRRDVTGREALDLDNEQNLSVNLSRLIIRWRGDVTARATLTDEESREWRIIGVGELERRRYLELLCERIT